MTPFLKWAGGKRWLVSSANHLFPDMTTINRYYEPFLGGGAIYFHLLPRVAFLSDVNADLINTYQVVKKNWKPLYKVLKTYHHKHSEEFYYQIRASRPRSPIQKAARFIYLNRTCWNGLYRVNKAGSFNVPLGTKTSVISIDDNFEQISSILQSASIIECDFEVNINAASRNDFLFIDPPYTIKHNNNGFIKYNEKLFSWDDQIRLRDSVVRAVARGCKVLVLNANHNSIKDLYNGLGDFYEITRSSVIAGDSNFRGSYSELAIKIY